jgi:hypothetical protein
LSKRDWQTVRVDTNSQLDTFALPLRWRHYESDPPGLQLLEGLVDVLDVESN